MLQEGGWIVHSLQQDGVLVEPGFLPDRTPAQPLASLTLTVRQAIFDEQGLHLRMIEKDFRAQRDDPVYAVIIGALALPSAVILGRSADLPPPASSVRSTPAPHRPSRCKLKRLTN